MTDVKVTNQEGWALHPNYAAGTRIAAVVEFTPHWADSEGRYDPHLGWGVVAPSFVREGWTAAKDCTCLHKRFLRDEEMTLREAEEITTYMQDRIEDLMTQAYFVLSVIKYQETQR